jgi:cytoskeletal protein CcmA (bactofilin family)
MILKRNASLERRQDSRTPWISTIGEELTITGNIVSKGKIQLDGQIQGDIDCRSLVLAENSQLEGSAIAEEVVIRGRLIGSVRALRVTLQSKCHVEGDIFHQSLVIEEGAYFEGKSRRSADPLSPSQTAPTERAIVKPHLVAERLPERGRRTDLWHPKTAARSSPALGS